MLSIISQLRAAPYLDLCDFQETYEISAIKKCGGIQQIKSVLGIENYNFSQFLTDNQFNPKEGICLPYWLFLRFGQDIRHEYMRNRVALHKSLCVQLHHGRRLQSIPLANNLCTYIPISNEEAKDVGAALLAQQYKLLNYDAFNSVMSLFCIREQRTVVVEIRCLASELTHHQIPAFCVEDDLDANTPIRKYRHIVSFSQQIHH